MGGVIIALEYSFIESFYHWGSLFGFVYLDRITIACFQDGCCDASAILPVIASSERGRSIHRKLVITMRRSS